MRKEPYNHRVASIALLAAIVVLGATQDASAAKRARGAAIEEGAGWLVEDYIPPEPKAVLLCSEAGQEVPLDEPCDVGFRLNVGGVFYDRLWLYPEGYVSLANAASPALTLDPNHSSAEALPGNIIAPFYSAIALNPNDGCISLDSTNDCDLSFNSYPDPDDDYFDDEGNPTAPPTLRGFRVSWGIAGTWTFDNDGNIADADHTRGIRPATPANDIHSNRFQMRLWDHENGEDGDFDIELIYDVLEWEIGQPGATPRSVAGFKIGSYSLNFGDMFDSFVGANLDGNDLLSTLPDVRDRTCPESQPEIDDEVPFFSKDNLYVCNNITIRFTGGVPALLGYTAPLTTVAVNPMGTIYTNDDAVLGWTVTNAGPETATNGRVSFTLPAAATYVSSTGATCTPTGQSLDCTLADLAPNAPAEIRVTVHSTQPGAVAVEATAAADQYDPTAADNKAISSVDFTAHADVKVDSCTGINSPTVGNAATLTCTVSNVGPQPATGLTLTLTLPSQLTFSSSTGCTANGATLTCTAANLASGANTTFVAQLNAAAAGSGNIGATLAATAPEDRVAANNTLSSAIVVQAQPPPPPPPPPPKKGGALEWLSLAALLEIARRRANRPRRA